MLSVMLSSNAEFPLEPNDPEVKSMCHKMNAQKELPVCKPMAERLKVISSLDMAVRAISTLRGRVAKNSTESGVAEIEQARLTILKWAQLAEFGDDSPVKEITVKG